MSDTTIITIPTPADFHYINTLDAHGWRDLAPYRYDEATQTLYRTHQLADGTLAALIITGTDTAIQVAAQSSAPLNDTQQAELKRDVARVFALDWNLSEFYAAMRAREHYGWVADERHGRMLCCPTVWEELVKTLFTTNTTWGQTKTMTARLVANYGIEVPSSFGATLRAFPTAAQLAGISAETLGQQTGMGYRAPYLVALAERVASGTLEVEAWAQRSLTADEMVKAIRGINGFGDYATGTMLRLLGYFDRLAIDTVAKAAFKRIMNRDDITEKDLRAYYEAFGTWRGLAMWMDCIRSDAMVASMLRADGQR
jgi:3-methyladenine DNA glycosylase/8-oxoguanine DNA glycosylase